MKNYQREPIVSKVEELDMNAHYNAGQYLQWRFEEMVELIKGKVFKMSPAPRSNHQRVELALASLFFNNLGDNSCEVFASPFDVYLTHENDFRKAENVVQPDVCIICDSSKIQEQGCVGAPDFIAEILSPSTRKKDLTLKRELYEEFYVPEFWAISVSERLIIRHLLNDGKYQQSVFTESATLTLKNFPDLEVEIADLFARIPKEE